MTRANGFDVLVVGAGVCGLATAVALARKGHRVRVLEKTPSLNDAGGSVSFLRFNACNNGANEEFSHTQISLL